MNDSHENWQTFRATPLFQGLAGEAVAAITSGMEHHIFSPGEFIVRQGAIEQRVWLLVEGRCEVVKETATSGATQSFKLTDLEPFESLGEMTLFNGQPRSASVVAKTDVKALSLSLENFESISEDDPMLAVQLAANMVSIVGHRLQQMDEWLTRVLHAGQEPELDEQWNSIRRRLQGNSPAHLL